MSKTEKEYIDRSGQHVRIRPNGTKEVLLMFPEGEGRTEQAHRHSCDTEAMINLYSRQGASIMPPESEFMDLTVLPDYQTCLNTVHRIESLFDQLPLNVKDAFNMNPKAFMAALEDPAKRDQLIALGVYNETAADNTAALKAAIAADVKVNKEPAKPE